MHFLSRKAYSDENNTQTFRFFENREGFYFKTHEGLVIDNQFDLDGTASGRRVSQVPTFTRQEVPDQTPDGQVRLMSTIVDISFPKYVNTIEDMNQGAYYSQTKELDFLNRTVFFTEYRHLDEYQSYEYPDNENRSKHTKEFVDTHMSDHADTLVIKDYSPDGAAPYMRRDTYYPNTYNQKNVNLYHHMNELVTLKIYGRNTINAGDIINLQLDDINYAVGERRLDRKRSGNYIVESAESVFSENNYLQILQVSKSGFQSKPESAGSYNNDRQTENSSTEQGAANRPNNVVTPSKAGAAPPPAGSLDKAKLTGLAADAGFSDDDAKIMAAIALAESSGNPSALNNTSSTGDLSYGLWQINMINKLGPERVQQFGINTYDELYTPEINAKAAKTIHESQGFEAWSVYKSGAYRKYL